MHVPVYVGSVHGMNSALCANCSEQSPTLKHKRRVEVAEPIPPVIFLLLRGGWLFALGILTI